jgi:hypothetical protein
MRTTMKNPTLIVSLLLPLNLCAQNPMDNLERGVEAYNALREYSKGLKSSKVTDEDMKTIQERRDKGVAYLKDVLRTGTAEQIKTARYFQANLDYELAFVHGMREEHQNAYQLFKGISEYMTTLKPNQFPITYQYFGKKFVVKWENFAPTQAEFYTSMGEISFYLGKYEDATQITRLGLMHLNTSDWYKYIGYNRMLDIYIKKRGLITESDYLDDAVQVIRSYFALSPEHKQTIREHKYPTFERGLRILKNQGDHRNIQMARRFGEAGISLKNGGELENAGLLYRLAIQGGYGTPIFFTEGIDLARKIMDKSLGILALDKLASETYENNCGELEEFAKLYEEFDKQSKATEFRKRAARCREHRQQDEVRLREEEKKRNHPFNVYVGVYAIPLAYSDARRDLGGHLDFRSTLNSQEFGFSMLKQNQDLFLPGERPRWDGLSLHYAFKRFTSRKASTYAGVLFGYTDKKFQTIEAGLKTPDTQGQFVSHRFQATEKEYSILLNWGAQWLWRVVGADIFMGIGGTYSEFKTDYADFNLKTTLIDSDYLNAKKRNALGVTARLGLSVGLNFGRKR